MPATSAMPPPGPATIRFQIEQSLAAPVDAVWELWTTRAGLERWWGSEQFVTSVRGLDPRAEGKIEIELRYRPAVEDPRRIAEFEAAGVPTSIMQRGAFIDVVPGAFLAFVLWVDAGPRAPPSQITMRVELSARRGGTRLLLSAEGPSNAHWTALAEANLRGQLERLAAALPKD
jgi:uncharacterized protein YndB with AHSA1/START domain